MPRTKRLPIPRFILESHKDPKKPTYIRLYLNYAQGRVKYMTGVKVAPEVWDKERQRVKRQHPQAFDLNATLNRIEETTMAIFRDTDRGNIGPAAFRDELDYRMGYKDRPEPAAPKIVSLLDFIPVYLDEKAATMPPRSLAALKTKVNPLLAYAEERRRRLDYGDIDAAFYHDFKAWLYRAPRQYSINNAGKIVKTLKQIMSEAQRRGFHAKTDFQNFTVATAKTTKIALDFTELEALYQLDLTGNPRLEKVRDLFLIGCYTGLRFSDFSRLTPEHLDKVNGKDVLTITMQKTGEPVSVPVLPITLALLKKYDFKAPRISNQKMNDYLKELGKAAGMTGIIILTNTAGGTRKEERRERWELLSTHVARRSFATNFYRENRASIADIMKITGHTTERQFMAYIAIDGKTNAAQFAELHKDKTAPLSKVAG